MFLFLLTTYFYLLAASVTSLLWALSGQVFVVVLDMDAICLLRPLRQHSKHSPLPEAVAGFWVLPGLYRQTDLLPSPLCYPQSTNTTIFCLGNCSGPGFSPILSPFSEPQVLLSSSEQLGSAHLEGLIPSFVSVGKWSAQALCPLQLPKYWMAAAATLCTCIKLSV